MIHVDITLEDARLIANRVGKNWFVTLSDGLKGTTAKIEWTDDQIAAVVAMAIHGDGEPAGCDIKKLYEIAEPLFTNLPIELRMIP